METATNIPAKAEILSAAAKLDRFLAQNPAAGTTHPAQFAYLNNLYNHAMILAKDENYDNAVSRAMNADAYAKIIPSIDQAIASCRYTFGVVYAETQAAEAEAAKKAAEAAAKTSSASVSSTATVSATKPAAAQVAVVSTPAAQNLVAEAKPEAKSETKSETATSDRSASLATSTVATETPPEIPKTGGISQSASMVFIVIVSLIAATAATAIYSVYTRKPKYSNPITRRNKRR